MEDPIQTLCAAANDALTTLQETATAWSNIPVSKRALAHLIAAHRHLELANGEIVDNAGREIHLLDRITSHKSS